MAGYFVAFIAIERPGCRPGSQVASLIPFFSPYLHAGPHAALRTVEPWEVGLALVLLVVSLAVSIWFAARIYSAGVLLYGQRVGLRAVLRATRVAR